MLAEGELFIRVWQGQEGSMTFRKNILLGLHRSHLVLCVCAEVSFCNERDSLVRLATV